MQTARIIIIGGGIVGCSVLYHLARAGCRDALLIERAGLTAGATWHAAGNVHNQNPIPNLSTLQAYSMQLYDGLAAEVGQAVGSHVVGGIFLAQSRARMQEFKFLAGKFKALGLPYELVTPADIQARFPLIDTAGLEGGAWDPDEGYVDPYSVAMGLAAGARKNGARILRNTRITAIRRTRSGHWRLSGDGGGGTGGDGSGDGDLEFECEIVVNAAGFWGNEVAQMVGGALPIVNMEHHYLVTESMPEVAAHIDGGGGGDGGDGGGELPLIRDLDAQFYLRQEGDGLLFGPWEKDCRPAWGGGGAPWDFGQELFSPDLERMEAELGAVYRRVPALGRAGIKRVVNGAISFTPDGRGLLGPLPGAPNFFVACGFVSGIAQGGGVGRALAEWLLEGETAMDLSFMDVARFGDWSTPAFARARIVATFPKRYEIAYPQLEQDSGRGLKTTPIYARLQERGAVFGQAYGWERPLWFAADGGDGDGDGGGGDGDGYSPVAPARRKVMMWSAAGAAMRNRARASSTTLRRPAQVARSNSSRPCSACSSNCAASAARHSMNARRFSWRTVTTANALASTANHSAMTVRWRFTVARIYIAPAGAAPGTAPAPATAAGAATASFSATRITALRARRLASTSAAAGRRALPMSFTLGRSWLTVTGASGGYGSPRAASRRKRLTMRSSNE